MFSYLCRKITFKQLVFTKLIFVFTFGWVKKMNQQFHREQLITEILNSEASNRTKSKYYVWKLFTPSRTFIWTSEKNLTRLCLWFIAIIYDVIFKTRWMCFCNCSYTTGSRGAVSPISSANCKTGGRKRISQKLRYMQTVHAAAAHEHLNTGTLELWHQLWTLTLTPSCLCTVISSEFLFFSHSFQHLFHLTLAC